MGVEPDELFMAAPAAPVAPLPYVSVNHGMRGYFAVLMYWCDDCGPEGFWEPFQTGIGSYQEVDGAVAEGKDWALAEGLEFRR